MQRLREVYASWVTRPPTMTLLQLQRSVEQMRARVDALEAAVMKEYAGSSGSSSIIILAEQAEKTEEKGCELTQEIKKEEVTALCPTSVILRPAKDADDGDDDEPAKQ